LHGKKFGFWLKANKDRKKYRPKANQWLSGGIVN
jgi:hypothetical protein